MEVTLNVPASFARFRKFKGLTKTAVSNALGITPPAYEYETPGKSANPTASRLFTLAVTFNVSIDYLLGLTDDPRPVNQILAENAAALQAAQKASTPEYATRAEIEELKARVNELETETLDDAELKFFNEEIAEMQRSGKAVDIRKAVRNAKFLAKIEKRVANVDAEKILD